MNRNDKDILDQQAVSAGEKTEGENSDEPALIIPEPVVSEEYVDNTIARLRRRWRIREMSIYECKKNALSPEQEYAIIEIDKQQEKMSRQDSGSGKLH